MLTLALVIGSSGCAPTIRRHDPSGSHGVAATPCVAADGTTRSRAVTGQLVGDYRLTMVATSGARTGRSTIGTLFLDGHLGHASIALESVGAMAAGDIGSRDPTKPGVLLIRPPNDSAASPMLRFGADANRTDLRPFDGAYLVLVVDATTAAGFSGRWRSGVGTTQSGGYFCALLS